MKRMLFNATHPEELRVAIVDGQRLIDLDLESAIRAEKKGNIYKAVVTKVEPGLEAAFVDYGAGRQGFLPLKEIYRGYFAKYDSKTPITEVKIAEEISEGQEMVVQVSKDERSGKGAALTTFVSLAGRFLVLMPNNPKGGGISRRVSGEERADLRQVLANLEVGDRHALIARTAGIGRNPQELQQDLDFLLKLWETIETAAAELKAPRLIYQESNLIVRSIRDHLATDIAEIVIDDREIYERARRFMQQVMPHNLTKLKHYDDNVPLFSRYQIEHQIESAFNREVRLPSGGSVVIDHTEALISIDVNSARATRGADIEETALQTNLEAADEIARQLRIRDLGGLVVIDLIDMTVSRNQRSVEARLKEALRPDRARVQVGKISRFGLLEMSRQRLRASLSDANYRACPRCEGTGTIRNVVSSSLSLLRLIEEKALQENTEAVQVVLPLDMATYLLNEKRHEVNQLESRLASRILIIPSEQLASPQFEIKRLRSEELDKLAGVPSYRQSVEVDKKEENITAGMKPAPVETPHIQPEMMAQNMAPAASQSPSQSAPPAPPRQTAAKAPPAAGPPGESGLLGRLWKAITVDLPGKTGKTGQPATPAADGAETAKPAARRGASRRGAQTRRPRSGAQQSRGGKSAADANDKPPVKRSTAGRRTTSTKPAPQPRTAPAKKPASPARRGRPAAKKPAAESRVAESRTADESTPRAAPPAPPGRAKPSDTAAKPADDMPTIPTRRDFAAHEPSQRVGRLTRKQTPATKPAEKPAPAPEISRSFPDDSGNR